MSNKRKTYNAQFKAKIAIEAVRERETINQIASSNEVLPVQVSQWKGLLLKESPALFERKNKAIIKEQKWLNKEKELFQKIGQLEVERDWLKKKSEKLGLLCRN